jgi:hypothetical protein
MKYPKATKNNPKWLGREVTNLIEVRKVVSISNPVIKLSDLTKLKTTK